MSGTGTRIGRCLPHILLPVVFMLAGNVAVASAEQYSERPRIGLVLGGGGAKGAAHVGVLKVLEELRIPVDCIAGTSMGALVGATYAAGSSAAEIDAAVRSIDWSSTLGSQGLRDLMPIEEKLAASSYSNSLDLGLSNGSLRGRGGLLSTQNVEGLLTELVANAQFTRDFDDLPIPFRAVATDMLAGEMVVLEEGELAVAMRASMAIPGVFTPVELDGMLLGDGGMMRNLPVDVARDLCADVVIAVWLSSPAPEVDNISSTFGMINRALDVMVGTNQRIQIDALGATDVGISVPMGDIGPADFTRSGEAIDLGELAAREARQTLSQYSLPEQEYAAWAEETQRRMDQRFRLAEVRIVGTDRVNPDYVAANLDRVQAGEDVDIDDIVADTQRIYALGDFEHVAYRLTGPKNEQVIEISPVEKPWGPDFISFDYGIASSDGADLDAILRVAHERTWINRLGGRWHSALQLGRKSLLETGFYQPLDVSQRYFMHPQLRIERTIEDIYLEGDRLATYDIREAYGQLDFGINFGSRMQARIGLRHGWQTAKVETGIQGLPELDREKDTSLQVGLTYDTRDSIALPTDGTYIGLRYAQSEGWLGSDLDYSLGEAVLSRAFDLNGNSLSIILGGADTFSGSTPVSQQIELGGIRTFPGLRPGELRGSDYWFAGTSYSWRLAELQPIFGQALFAGIRLQAGEMGQDVSGGERTGVLYGISGSLSGRTPIGSFLVSLGYVRDQEVRLQFMLGRPVPEGSLLDEIQ